MSSLKDQLARLEGFLATAKLEEAKLSGGCKASAAKLRNSLLEIGKGCYELRKSALDLGKAIPVKHRVKPEAPLPADAPLSPPELKRQEGMSAVDVAHIAAAVQELAPTPSPPATPLPPATPATPAKKPRAPRKKAVALVVVPVAAPIAAPAV